MSNFAQNPLRSGLWDAIRDPEDLTIWLEVNGERRQSSSTGVMIVKIAELIELASRIYTLYPGDLIYTKALEGVSCEGVSAIHAGDILHASCEGIGEMTLQVR